MSFLPKQKEKNCLISCDKNKVNQGLCDCLNRKREVTQKEFKPLVTLIGHLNGLKNINKDKSWASDGSDFHKQCRIDLQKEIDQYEEAIKILKDRIT